MCFWFSAEMVIKRRGAHEERERLVGWIELAHTSSERETDWRNEPQAIFGSVVLLQQYIALFNVIHFDDFIVFILHLLVCMCLIRLSSAEFTLVWACSYVCVCQCSRLFMLWFESNDFQCDPNKCLGRYFRKRFVIHFHCCVVVVAVFFSLLLNNFYVSHPLRKSIWLTTMRSSLSSCSMLVLNELWKINMKD